MKTYKTYKSGEEKFEEQYCSFKLCDTITKPEMENFKQFRKQEYISIIKGEIEYYKSLKHEPYQDEMPLGNEQWKEGFNKAIEEVISHLQSELKAIEEDK